MEIEKCIEIMKKKPNKRKSQLEINNSTIGDTIEIQMERLMENDGIDSSENKELKYTRSEEGVIAITDIRSDKFDMAIEETMKVEESEKKYLESKRKKREEILKNEKNIDNAEGGQSVQTTSEK